MNQDYCTYVRRLQAVSLEIRGRAEQAELLVEEAHSVIQQIARAEIVRARMFLGAVVLTQPYGVEAVCLSSGQVVQTALSSVSGFGCILWDSEEYAQLCRSQQFEYEARLRFVIIGDCRAAIKATILGELEPRLR